MTINGEQTQMQQERLNYFVEKSQMLFDSKFVEFIRSITLHSKIISDSQSSSRSSWKFTEMHLIALKK